MAVTPWRKQRPRIHISLSSESISVSDLFTFSPHHSYQLSLFTIVILLADTEDPCSVLVVCNIQFSVVFLLNKLSSELLAAFICVTSEPTLSPCNTNLNWKTKEFGKDPRVPSHLTDCFFWLLLGLRPNLSPQKKILQLRMLGVRQKISFSMEARATFCYSHWNETFHLSLL